MTQTRTPRRRSDSPIFPLVVIALVVGLIVGLALALAISRLSGEITATPAAAAEVQMTRIDAIPADQDPDALADQADIAAQVQTTSALGTDFGIVHLALGDAGWNQAQVDEILMAADRVCEGFTAEVPITVLEQTVAAGSGMGLPTAHDFVALVLGTRC